MKEKYVGYYSVHCKTCNILVHNATTEVRNSEMESRPQLPGQRFNLQGQGQDMEPKTKVKDTVS